MALVNVIEKVRLAKSPMDVLDYMHKGVPIGALKNLSDTLDMSNEKLCSIIGVKTRTMSRRKTLNLEEADKLIRLVNVYITALKVFEDKQHALQWLSTQQSVFDDQTPLSLLDTDFGAREVERLLMQIEYGVYV